MSLRRRHGQIERRHVGKVDVGPVPEAVAGDRDEFLVEVDTLHLVPAGELLEVLAGAARNVEQCRAPGVRAPISSWRRSASAT